MFQSCSPSTRLPARQQRTGTTRRQYCKKSHVRARAVTSMLPIFLLLASLTFSSVKSFPYFVSACEKAPRHSNSSPQQPNQYPYPYQGQRQRQRLPKFRRAVVRSLENQSNCSSSSFSRISATATCVLTASATTRNYQETNPEDDCLPVDDDFSFTPQESQEDEQDQQYIEYQKRKADWVNRYTSLESLRETFGANKNKIWGDLDAASARRLYKTLLPKALLELVQAGVQPEDLAPLAYQARVAAKLYARERCHLPARLMANLFDGIRTFKRYGRFQPVGMSYEQVWEKYQKAVLEQHHLEEDGLDEFADTDMTIRHICMRILESSCRTNEGVDRWILPPDDSAREERDDLMKIAKTLEEDVRNLLYPISPQKRRLVLPKGKFWFALRWLVQVRRRFRGGGGDGGGAKRKKDE